MSYANLRSELTKFNSSGWCIAGIAGAILIPPLLVLSNFLATNVETKNLLTSSLLPLYYGQLGIALAGAFFWGQEYQNHTLQTTLLSIPSRKKMISVKLLLLTIIVTLAGLISSGLCLLVTYFHYNFILTMPLFIEFMEHVGLILLSWIQISWITSGIAMISTSVIIPISLLLPLILGMSQMLFSFLNLAKYLPDLATLNLFLPTPSPTFLNLEIGLLVQFIWVLVCLIPALRLTMTRDVR